MKTKESILKSQLLHDNIPFSNKTFEKDWGYVLEAMEEYRQQEPLNRNCMYCEKPLKDGEAIILCKECIQ